MTPSQHHILTQRTARYYTIGNSDKPEDIWFVLHGYGHRAESFIKNFLPITDEKTLIVAPEALSRFYIKGFGGTIGASWMTREDRLNEIKDYIAYLDLVYSELLTRLSSPPKRKVIVGFSQGAPAAMRLIAEGKAQVDEIVIWSGDVPRDLHFSDFKKRSSGSRNWFLVGDSDEIVHADIYAESENLYMRHGIPYEKIKFNGGHEIPAETLLSLQERIGR